MESNQTDNKNAIVHRMSIGERHVSFQINIVWHVYEQIYTFKAVCQPLHPSLEYFCSGLWAALAAFCSLQETVKSAADKLRGRSSRISPGVRSISCGSLVGSSLSNNSQDWESQWGGGRVTSGHSAACFHAGRWDLFIYLFSFQCCLMSSFKCLEITNDTLTVLFFGCYKYIFWVIISLSDFVWHWNRKPALAHHRGCA